MRTLWLVSDDTLEPYEHWPSDVGIFKTYEDAKKFIKENPIKDDIDEYSTHGRYYLEPREVVFYD